MFRAQRHPGEGPAASRTRVPTGGGARYNRGHGPHPRRAAALRPRPPRCAGGAVNRTLARLGTVLSAFAVFSCGWLAMNAMNAGEWVKMGLYSALALGAAAVGSGFSRQGR